MKKLLQSLLLLTAGLLAQDSPPAPAVLIWKNVFPRYESFKQIKPILANDGEQSVFISRFHPDYSAQLERFNEEKGVWEAGAWGMRCDCGQRRCSG
jgi:hypothetical protein